MRPPRWNRAARLGMRAGDIRDLRLEDLRWDEARIERPQTKTGVPVVLPLTEEIGDAGGGRTLFRCREGNMTERFGPHFIGRQACSKYRMCWSA
jgi:integrase